MEHPADKTWTNVHALGLIVKQELFLLRQELLASSKPSPHLKEKVRQKHDELMEILKVEEKIYRETC